MLEPDGFDSGDFGIWALRDLAWALAAGAASSVALGSALVWINRRLPENRRLSATRSGFVALGLSLLAYGLSELVEGNGFVWVFLLAVTIRNAVHRVEYPRQLDHLLSEIEQLVMVVVIALFGVALGNGLMNHVGSRDILLCSCRPSRSASSRILSRSHRLGPLGKDAFFHLLLRHPRIGIPLLSHLRIGQARGRRVLYGGYRREPRLGRFHHSLRDQQPELVLRWVDPSRHPEAMQLGS